MAMSDTEHASGFLARWSERKLAARKAQTPPADPQEVKEPVADPIQAVEPGPAPVREPDLTDADMPPLESLDGTSDYSGFLSRGVSATLRREALSRLFHSPHLNLADHLDDFPEDYTRFAPLGDLVTADRRHQLDLAARRLLEPDPEAATDPETERPAPAVEGHDPPGDHRLSTDPPTDSGAACTSLQAEDSDASPAPPSPAESA
jgi:hypothetical protein